MADRNADIDITASPASQDPLTEAYTLLGSADQSDLVPEELERLADAAWWLGKAEESTAARQRAYAGHSAAGRAPESAAIAVRLCFESFERGEASVGMGWLMRAERDLREEPACVQHGFLALAQAFVTHGDDVVAAMAKAERATEIGQRFTDRDLIAMGIHAQGLVHVSAGHIAEGLALLDEAMISVVAGELSPHFTGVIYCNVLETCLDLADLARAAEWNEAARAWCESLPQHAPFTSRCRISRAQVANLRGAWPEAEAEALRACADAVVDASAAAKAFYETAEIRRRIGNVAGAEESFARAHALGFEPQPGLALLRLAQGKAEAAHSALRLAVDGESMNRQRRARLLAAQVEVAVAVDDLDTARSAAVELDELAAAFATPALGAAAAAASAMLRLAEGDIARALERARHACAVWHELKLPYEAARAHMIYGLALRQAGDEDSALLELRAALASFERLGAASDAAAAAELLPGRRELPSGLTAREAEVLRLVATGKSNRDIAAELVLSEHTVARHLQNIFAKLEVSSRSAATAFAFDHDLA
ncbi:MAG: helix-turn-helix transcriptional regulator [Actinomycetota bacterium]